MGVARRLAWGALLWGLVGYHAVAVYDQHTQGKNGLSALTRQTLFMAEWDMFTFIVKTHAVYHFEHWDGAAWVTTPMERWFPFQYCHGARWNRSTLRKSRLVRETFLVAACRKTGAERVRAVREGWRVTPGQYEQPHRDYDVDVLETLSCDRADRVPVATGVVL